MKHRSKIILITMVMVFALLLAACGGTESAKTFDDAHEKIRTHLDAGRFVKQDGEILKHWVELDPDSVAKFAFYGPETNLSVNEILLVEAKDEKDMDALKKTIHKHLQTLEESYSNYLPEQGELVKKAVVKTDGKLLLLVIAEDPSVFDDVL